MPKIIVAPRNKKNTHDVSLTDGKRTVGLIICDSNGSRAPRGINRAPTTRTALKTSSGSTKWADFEPPWSPVAQEDFSGGMGKEDFDDDVTRFLSSCRMNTAFEKRMFLGPQETYCYGHRSQEKSLPGSVTWYALLMNLPYLAVSFNASANYNAINIYTLVKRVGTPANALTIALCANGAAKPGAVLQSKTITTTNITDVLSEFYKSVITSQSLTSGTTYWIKVSSTVGTAQDHWEIGVNNSAGTTKGSTDDTTWATSAIDLYYRMTDADSVVKPILFQYRGCEYLVANTDGAAPKIYINGDRGAADANTGALLTLVDATKTWVTNEWAGCIVKVIKGTGSSEDVPWRVIASNTATTLTLTSAWNITHDTTTEYIILGSNKLTEITGHGLSVSVTDILVVNDTIYACEGDAVNIRRIRFYNNAGTWTAEYADDSTNKAMYLEAVRNSSGVLQVWKANNSDASGFVSVAVSAVVDWGSNLSFGAALTLKDQWGKINGLKEYTQECWIAREGTMNAASGTIVDEIALSEIHTLMESSNGKALMTHNVYLYFNLGSGLERYYNGALDDVGPNRDDGLPTNRQGVVSCLTGYPGRYFAGVDAGANGYSSIIMQNGTGWHEVYRAPAIGERIFTMDFQAIPGSTPDRLWAYVGSDLIWLPMPSLTIDPTKDNNYRYTHEASLITGYIYSGMVDAYKFYQSFKIFAESLVTNSQFIEIDYQADNESVWTELNGVFDKSPMSEQNLRENYGVTGKRIRFRVRMSTTDNSKTPIVKVLVVENVSRVKVKYSYSFMYRMKDDDMDLQENHEKDADDRQAVIDEWAENMTPLVLRSQHKRYDNKTVFIDPTQTSLIAETQESYIERITMVER